MLRVESQPSASAHSPGRVQSCSYKWISDIGGDLSQLQGKSVSHSLSREDDGLCQQKMAGDVSCVPGRQQRTCVTIRSHRLLPPTPHFSFLRTPRSVQFENGNPLFYLKLGSLALLHQKGDSLSRQQLVPSLITVRQEPKHGCQLRTPLACQTSDQQHFSIRHTRSHEQEPLNVFASVGMRVGFAEAVMGAVRQETLKRPEPQCWSSWRVVRKQLATAWTESPRREGPVLDTKPAAFLCQVPVGRAQRAL